MPNITIYVPRELADRVRKHDVPISATCQKALHRQVRIEQRKAAGITGATARVDRQRAARAKA